MQPKLIVGVIVAAVVVVGFIALLVPKRRPPSLVFTCARCRRTTRHNHRTEEAWRNGSAKLFCNDCHRLWLQSRPQPPHGMRSTSARRSGCLGVVVLAAVVPVGMALTWLYT